jgi:hypothetical protein
MTRHGYDFKIIRELSGGAYLFIGDEAITGKGPVALAHPRGNIERASPVCGAPYEVRVADDQEPRHSDASYRFDGFVGYERRGVIKYHAVAVRKHV